MKTLHRVGILLLAFGLVLVIGVAIIWVRALLATPPQPVSMLKAGRSFAAPALSTIAPSSPLAGQGTIAAPLDDGSPLPAPTATPSTLGLHAANASDMREETIALNARNRQSDHEFFRLAIPALDVDVPVVPVGSQEKVGPNGRIYSQWAVPNTYAVGWHDSSALPGETGNTVLNGHNNVYGAVFSNLVDLTLGERLILYRAQQQHVFQVVHREFMPEKGEPLRSRLRNARWILPSDDMRLTLVTCWPNTTNTHRLVVVAEALAPQASH